MAFYRMAPQFADVANLDTVATVADAATVTFDASVANMQTVTLGGNRTLAFANFQPGRTLQLILVQDATGSRTVTWPSGIKWQGGSPPTLTATATKSDLVTVRCVGVGAYLGSASLNY